MARVCAEPGCPEIAVDRRHCAKHKQDRRAWEESRRSEASARAQKWYKTKRWQKRRATQLAQHPYCQCPEHDGQRVPATVVDHIEPHRGDPRKFWGGRLQSLTKRCHDSWAQRKDKANAID